MSETDTRGSKVIIYTHDYCAHAHLLARALDGIDVEIEWRDIMHGDPTWQDELRNMARGYLSVPTVVFEDGTVMVEPWPAQVLGKLGVERQGFFSRVFRRNKVR